jgi:hypothetical protein
MGLLTIDFFFLSYSFVIYGGFLAVKYIVFSNGILDTTYLNKTHYKIYLLLDLIMYVFPNFNSTKLGVTADLPTSPESTTANFDDDTAVVAMDSDPAIASQEQQTDLLAIQNLLYIYYMCTTFLDQRGSSGQSVWLQILRSEFDSRP